MNRSSTSTIKATTGPTRWTLFWEAAARHQPEEIIDDFYHRADLLRSLAADGTPMLMICGLYQLFGEYFETVDGTRLDGIGVIGAYTVGQNVRMIGNLVEHSDQFGDVIGYENHSGQTFLREGVQPSSAPSIRMAEATMAKTIPRARACTT